MDIEIEEKKKDGLPLFTESPESTEIVESELTTQDSDGVQPSFMLGSANRQVDISGIPISSYGVYLKAIRERNNIKISDLSEVTKLQKNYIIAVEEEDLNSLPPLVYVLAYIKKLCSYYMIPEEIVIAITEEIQCHLKYESPEDPLKDLELSTENPIILKKILIFGSLCVILFIGLIVGLVFLAVGDNSAPSAGGEVESLINESRLKTLNGKIELEMNELKQKSTL